MAKKDKKDQQDDYDIGYGKPPKSSQFAKGKSGNPKGRPKGSLNLETAVRRAFTAKVPVTENGRRRMVSKLEISIAQVANKAAGGDLKAAKMMFDLLPSDSYKTTNEVMTPDLIAEREHAIRIAARLLGKATQTTKEDDHED